MPERSQPQQTCCCHPKSRSAATRVNGESFEGGDMVGVFAKDGSSYYAENVAYTFATNKFVSTTPIVYANANQELAFSAIYPYSDDLSDQFVFNVDNDQSTEAAYEASDLLVAKTEATSSSCPDLQFFHKMSLIEVRIVSSDVTTDNCDVVVNAVASADCDIDADEYVANGSASAISTFAANDTFKAVVAPQSISTGTSLIDFTLNGETYNWNVSSSVVLKSGYKYICEVSIEDGAVKFEGDIEPWVDGGDIDGAVEGGDPAEDSGNFDLTFAEVTYEGDMYSNNTVVWSLYLYNKEYMESAAYSGEFISLQLICDPETQTFKDGVPTGDFSVTDVFSPVSTVAGDIYESGYCSGEDLYTAIYFTEGTFSIKKADGDNYTISANLTAEDKTNFEFVCTRDFSNDEVVKVDDNSYFSDIDGDYTQEITDVFMDYNGDALGKGNAVWKLHIWGDGSQVNSSGNPTNGEGTYLCVQLYAPLENASPVGTYTLGEKEECVTNTFEPGHVSNGNYAGSWLYEFEDSYIAGMTPAVSGELTISENSDGTFSISYKFGDDNPYGETSYFSGEYTGTPTIMNRLDTGDFDISASSFVYYGEKLCDNHSWKLKLVSKEYVKSEGQSGMVAEFVLTTSMNDSYYFDVSNKHWEYKGVESTDDYSIHSGTITNYENGVGTASAVNGGNITVTQATNSNYMYYMDLQDISTVDGETYYMYYISDLVRTDDSKPAYPNINVSEENIDLATIEYYGGVAGFTNWDIALYNDIYNGTGSGDYSQQLAIILNMYFEGSLSFEDGIPEGEYSYVPSGSGAGVWSDYTMINKGFDVVGLKSGTVNIESLGGNKYRFTLDFVLDQDDSTLTGVYEGEVEPRNQAGSYAPRH